MAHTFPQPGFWSSLAVKKKTGREGNSYQTQELEAMADEAADAGLGVRMEGSSAV